MYKITLILLWLVGFKIRTLLTMSIIFLQYNAIQSSRSVLTFRSNPLFPSSAEPILCHLLLYLLFTWLTVRPWRVRQCVPLKRWWNSEYTRRHIPQDSVLHSLHRESVMFNTECLRTAYWTHVWIWEGVSYFVHHHWRDRPMCALAYFKRFFHFPDPYYPPSQFRSSSYTLNRITAIKSGKNSAYKILVGKPEGGN